MTWAGNILWVDLTERKTWTEPTSNYYREYVGGTGIGAKLIYDHVPPETEGLAPEKPYSRYRHNGFEDNADAHLKRTVMGREVVVAVSEGKLDFGPWEQIFYGEFDGKRRKRVLVKIIGE